MSHLTLFTLSDWRKSREAKRFFQSSENCQFLLIRCHITFFETLYFQEIFSAIIFSYCPGSPAGHCPLAPRPCHWPLAQSAHNFHTCYTSGGGASCERCRAPLPQTQTQLKTCLDDARRGEQVTGEVWSLTVLVGGCRP